MFEEENPGGRLGDLGRLMYVRKFSAGFSKEMRRSVRVILERWLAKNVELE
jgi:hypothetical protein